jgi:hippurate hydrolase
MLDEGLLERFPFDEIYGYHNWPYLPRNVFAIRSGPCMAASDNFEIKLHGSGGHAASPHRTRDAVPAAAQLVLALQTLVSRETDPLASAVISVTNLTAGSGAENVITGQARISGTVRTYNQDLRNTLEARIAAMAESIAAAFALTSEFTYARLMDPVVNHAESTQLCQQAAAALVGEENVHDFEPVMGGEDFGAFLQHRPGAFIVLGQAEPDPASPHNVGVHSPFYDFNDNIIPTAATYFAELAERRLPVD